MRRALSLLALGLTPAASAFELERSSGGAALHWPTGQYVYEVTPAPAQPALSPAARRSLDAWALASRGGLAAGFAGAGGEPAGDDGRSTVAVLATWPESFGEAGRTLGHTELFYDTVTGALREADLLLNGERFRFGDAPPDGVDLESVLVHEAGHALGLAHACGDGVGRFPSCFDVPDEPPGNRRRVVEAVMAPTLSVGARRRAPNGDDLAGLLTLYPPRSERAPVALGAPARLCPGGQLRVPAEGALAGDRLWVRLVDGSSRAVAGALESGAFLLDESALPADEVDMLLIGETGLTGSLVAVTPPTPCAAPAPQPPPMGCGCTSHRQPAPASAILLLVLPLGLLRPRALLLLLALSLPGEAWAFKCSRTAVDSGPSLVWMSRSVPWWADSGIGFNQLDHAAAMAAIRASYAAWEEVDCSDVVLPFAGEMAGLKAAFDPNAPNQNVITQHVQSWPYDQDVIAVTTNAFDTRSGVVVDADIEINGQYFNFLDATLGCDTGNKANTDLQNAITHEVGHVLGLDHPPASTRNQESTMYAKAPACELKKRSLAEDDRLGLCYIYPTGQPAVQCFPPEGPSFALTAADDGYGCRAGGPLGDGALGMPALALLALLALRRR